MSSIFSAAVLVDGASDCTELATEPLRPQKSIPGADLCLEPDGAFQSATMSESSATLGIGNASEPRDLFSFAAHLPARNIAQPIVVDAASTQMISSSKPSASSPSLDLLGLHLRTHLASELSAMTGSLTKWKLSASPAGRSWWVLQMPERPIGASDSGSYVPTGRANKGGLPDSHGKLPGFVPTPAAQTGAKKGHPEVGGGGSGARKAAEAFFPTVTAQDYGSNMGGAAGRTGTKRLSLSSLARSLGLSGRQFLAALYENMMGFPPGWLSSVALLTATPSDPLSQKSSDAQS